MSTVGNADPALLELPAPTSVAPAVATSVRVRCLDDEPAALALLARALGERFQVVTHTDPDSALASLERGGFAVVISDLLMPGMPGPTFLERVRSLAPATVRLGLTGCLDQQLPPDLAFGILTKPCPLSLLEATVSAAAQFHALRADAALAARAAATRALPVPESGPPPAAPQTGATRVDTPRCGPAPSIPEARARRLGLAVRGTSVELGPRATRLGRATSNDIVVQDPRIAPRHLRFFRSWRGVTVQDLSGTSAVRLNGARLSGVRFIQPGDCIGLGPFDVCVIAVDDG